MDQEIKQGQQTMGSPYFFSTYLIPYFIKFAFLRASQFVIYHFKNVQKCSSAFDNYIDFTLEEDQLL